MSRVAAANDGWVGSYTPVVLTRVLKRAAEEGQTGALSVVSGPAVKTVHFVKGSVKFAASNVRRDRLGESMLAHEFISKEDYQLASQKMQSDGCRFGEALLLLGRLTEKELDRELAIQVQRIVLSLFRLPEGMYSFDDKQTLSTSLPFGLSVPSLLLKGLRSIEDGKVILSSLPAADCMLRVSRSTGLKIDVEKLSPGERGVLELAGDGMSVGDIIRKCTLGRSAAFRSCFALLALGLLEPVPDTEEEVEPRVVDAGPVELTSGGDEVHDQVIAELVHTQFDRLDALSEADLLGIRTGASLAEIETAYDGLKEEWRELRRQTRDPELIEKIGAIELRLASAFAQLVVGHESERKPSPAPQREPEDFAKRDRARQLERDAELHLQVRDFRGALSLLHELIALEPETARFQAMLGKAMQHQSATRKHAEQHFLEAARLAPNDASHRVALGRYYQLLGNHARAITELRAALDLDPRNDDALALLGRMREPTRMQKLLQRVFG